MRIWWSDHFAPRRPQHTTMCLVRAHCSREQCSPAAGQRRFTYTHVRTLETGGAGTASAAIKPCTEWSTNRTV